MKLNHQTRCRPKAGLVLRVPHVWGTFKTAARRLHRDEKGTISIASVFALLLIVFLLGMVMNSVRQVDRKVKLQNAADAATAAGTLQVARNMNTLAFTNHLISDLFALTAFFREAEQRNAEEAALEILHHWRRVAPELAGSEFPPIADLGSVIETRVAAEEELVVTYSHWAAQAAMTMLPVLESLLAEEAVPNFQRELIAATPRMAHLAAQHVARRQGESWPRPVVLQTALWTTTGQPYGHAGQAAPRTSRGLPVLGLPVLGLPVVDPVQGSAIDQIAYVQAARQQRSTRAHQYLQQWNDESLRFFDRYAELSQFGSLWRSFTCGHLEHLLDVEQRDRNLPMQLRRWEDFPPSRATRGSLTEAWSNTSGGELALQEWLEQEFMLVGVVYAPALPERLPRLFGMPLPQVTMACAQAQYFVPRRRLVLPTVNFIQPPFSQRERIHRHQGGLPGNFVNEPRSFAARVDQPASRFTAPWAPELVVHRQSGEAYPSSMDLMTQNWEAQLVPLTCAGLSQILSRPPHVLTGARESWPHYEGLTNEQLQWINHH